MLEKYWKGVAIAQTSCDDFGIKQSTATAAKFDSWKSSLGFRFNFVYEFLGYRIGPAELKPPAGARNREKLLWKYGVATKGTIPKFYMA